VVARREKQANSTITHHQHRALWAELKQLPGDSQAWSAEREQMEEGESGRRRRVVMGLV